MRPLMFLYEAVFVALTADDDTLPILLRKLVLVLGLVTGAMVPFCTGGYYGYLIATGASGNALPTVLAVSVAGAIIWQSAYWYCRVTKKAPALLLDAWLLAVFIFVGGMAITVPAFPSQVGALGMTIVNVIVATKLMPLHFVTASIAFALSVYSSAAHSHRHEAIVAGPQPEAEAASAWRRCRSSRSAARRRSSRS